MISYAASCVGAFGIDLILGTVEFVRGLAGTDKGIRRWARRTETRFRRVRRAAHAAMWAYNGHYPWSRNKLWRHDLYTYDPRLYWIDPDAECATASPGQAIA